MCNQGSRLMTLPSSKSFPLTSIILLISPAFTLSLCIRAKSRLSFEARPAHLLLIMMIVLATIMIMMILTMIIMIYLLAPPMSGLTRTASSHSGRQLFNLKMGIDDLIIIYMSVYE